LCVRGIDFAIVYDFSIGFENCSDRGVYFHKPLDVLHYKSDLFHGYVFHISDEELGNCYVICIMHIKV